MIEEPKTAAERREDRDIAILLVVLTLGPLLIVAACCVGVVAVIAGAFS